MRVCPRNEPLHGAWYFVEPYYYCQHCDGRILDKEYLKKIIDYNTPTNIDNRYMVIENKLKKARWGRDKLFKR